MARQRIPSPSQIEALESQVATISKAEHPELTRLLSDLIAAFPDAFGILDSPDLPQPRHYVVVMLFATKAFFTLRCATDLAMKGNYAQVQVLNRLLMEECMLAKYYHRHPGEAVEYLNQDNARTPAMKDMLNSLQLEHLYQDYEQLSQHAHSRLYSTWTTVVGNHTQSGWVLRSAPEYDANLFLQCTAFSMKYAAEMLQFLAQLSNDLGLADRIRSCVVQVCKFLDLLAQREASQNAHRNG